MFAAFRSRNYALFWTGSFVSNTGTWVQAVALGWLVYDMTHSASWLGLVSFMSSAPSLCIGLLGGAIADRADRKTVMLAAQVTMAASAFVLAALTGSGLLHVWHVLAIALVSGIAAALYVPVIQAMLPSLVSAEDLLNAISLNSVQFNLARIIGPMVAGFSYSRIGPAGCFFLNASSFLVLIVVFRSLHLPERVARAASPLRQDLVEGFRYAASDPLIVAMLGLAAGVSLFGFPYIILMPAFARDALELGPDGLGILMGSLGAGAVVGALALATRNIARKALLALVSAGLLAVVLCAFSMAGDLGHAAPTLFVLGGTQVACVASLHTTVQTRVADEMRGRVVSMLTLALFGLSTLGGLLFGTLADQIGVRAAFALGAAAIALLVTALASRSQVIFEPVASPPVLETASH